jgi:hypothetical protein
MKLGEKLDWGRFLGVYHLLHIKDGVYTLEYDMKLFLISCLERYEDCVAQKPKYKQVLTPFVDELSLADEDLVDVGELAGFAASVLMKVLWGCRMCRWDCLRQTIYLSSFVTCWTVACDRMVFRLMCYIKSTLDWKLALTIGDPMKDWKLQLYTDADLGSCRVSKKSTSGVIAGISAANTWAPIAGSSGKQKVVSESTPEAELVAAAKGLRMAGLPLLDLWEKILQRHVQLIAEEDNQAALDIIRHGYSSALRCMSRSHGLSLARLHQFYHGDKSNDGQISIQKCDTKVMRADGFTKAFKVVADWLRAVKMMGIKVFGEFGIGEVTYDT